MLKIRKFTLFLGDIIFVYLALFLMVVIGFWGNFSWHIFQQHLLPFTFLYIIWFAIFYIFGLYELTAINSRMELLAKVGQPLVVAGAIGLAFFYLIPIFGKIGRASCRERV